MPERLQTSHVADGRTLGLPDDSADLVFSYITLQHCHHDDALALAREAVRVTKPGGHIALNFRTWVPQDVVLWPAGKIDAGDVAAAGVGPQHRPDAPARPARLAGQPPGARRRCCSAIGDRRHRRRASSARRSGAPFGVCRHHRRTFEGVHRSHWWLVATVSDRTLKRVAPWSRSARSVISGSSAAVAVSLVGHENRCRRSNRSGGCSHALHPRGAQLPGRRDPVTSRRPAVGRHHPAVEGHRHHRRGRRHRRSHRASTSPCSRRAPPSRRSWRRSSPPPASSSSTTRRPGACTPTCR